MKSVSRLAFLAVVGFCALLPTAGHAATFYNAGCTGSTSTLTCTFTALPGFAFQDSQAADISVSGVTSASETISGGLGATSSTVDLFPSGKNVDGTGILLLRMTSSVLLRGTHRSFSP